MHCLQTDGVGERCLADARLTANEHEAAVSDQGSSDSLVQESEFLVAPDKAVWRWSGHIHMTSCRMKE
jgi:hypothetical protein